MKLLSFIKRTLCSHPTADQIRKWSDGRMYVECLKCGDHSNGITVHAKTAEV